MCNIRTMIVLVISCLLIIGSAQDCFSDEVDDYINHINPSKEAVIRITHNKAYNTTLIVIKDGDTIYVKNLKIIETVKQRKPKRVIKKKKPSYKIKQNTTGYYGKPGTGKLKGYN